MAEDMNSLFKQVQNMVDSGNIPKDLQNMVNQFSKNSSKNEKEEDKKEPTISPEMINSISNLFQNSSKDERNKDSSSFGDSGIDINTLMKMKHIIEAMNQKDDPRSNLLYSLKPYLRESRKNKLDQYVSLLNMTKIADVMKEEKKENSDDASNI